MNLVSGSIGTVQATGTRMVIEMLESLVRDIETGEIGPEEAKAAIASMGGPFTRLLDAIEERQASVAILIALLTPLITMLQATVGEGVVDVAHLVEQVVEGVPH